MRLPPTREEIAQINAREAERLRQQRAAHVEALPPRAVPNAIPIPFDPKNPDPVAEAHLRLAEARQAVRQGQSPVDFHVGQPQKITAHVVDINPLHQQAARAAAEEQWQKLVATSGPLKRIGLQLMKDAHLEKLADEAGRAMLEQRNLFLDNSTATPTPERIAGENRTIEIAEAAVRESIASWLARRPTGELIRGPQTPLVNLTRRQEGSMSVIRDERGYEVRPETDARVLTVGRQAVSLLREVKYADAEVARTINKLFLDFALRFTPNVLGTAVQTPELEKLQREFEKSMQAVLQPLLAERQFAPRTVSGKSTEKNAQFLASDLWFFVPQLSLQLQAEKEKLLKLYTGICPVAREKAVLAQLEKYLNATLCISVQLHQQAADLQARLPTRLQGVFQRTPPPAGEIVHLSEVAHIGGQNPRIATPPVEAFTQEQQAQAREAKPERSPDVQVISMNNQEEFNRLYQELLKFQAANRARAALAAPRRIILVGSWFFKDWDYTLSKQVGVMPGKKAKGKSEMVAATPKQRLDFLVNFLQMGENNKIPCLIVYSEEQAVVGAADLALINRQPPTGGMEIFNLEVATKKIKEDAEREAAEKKKGESERLTSLTKKFEALRRDTDGVKQVYQELTQAIIGLKERVLGMSFDGASIRAQKEKIELAFFQLQTEVVNVATADRLRQHDLEEFKKVLEAELRAEAPSNSVVISRLIELRKGCARLTTEVSLSEKFVGQAETDFKDVLETVLREEAEAAARRQSAPSPPPMPPRPPQQPVVPTGEPKNPADAKSAFGDISDLSF